MVAPRSDGLPSVSLPVGFQWRLGTEGDRKRLLTCLQLAFSEAFPEQTSWVHLAQTVNRYFDPQTSPVWWIEDNRLIECNNSSIGKQAPQKTNPLVADKPPSAVLTGNAAACVWACQGISQTTGKPIAYVLALWVSPSYRRKGLGTAAMQVVKEWGERRGCDAIELQVFGLLPFLQ